MFTPSRETPPKGSSFRSPLSMSPFSSGGTRHGRPRFRPSQVSGPYETSLISGRSQQQASITIEEASTHRVLSYGQTLPVQVSEALSTRDSGKLSCKLGQNGWAWLIKGNKLLIWKYVPSALSKSITCCELHLPSTELYHKAELSAVISVTSGEGKQSSKEFSASVVNVSPEGVIRMWPDFANPGIFLENFAGLKGKEFSTLVPLPPHGCIVMTTDNDILLLAPNQSSIICRLLNDSSGLFSGIGRRMSSFLFTSTASGASVHPPKLAVSPADAYSTERYLYVLANGNLQKWEISNGREKSYNTVLVKFLDRSEPLLLLCQVDLIDRLKEEVEQLVEIEDGSLEKVVPLDITSAGYCLAVLCCAVVKTDRFKAVLLLGTKKSSGGDLSGGFESFIPLQYSLDIEDENSIPKINLLIPAGSYQAFAYNRDFITANPVSEVREGLVDITFSNETSKLVGGGSFGNDSVFLSKRHGLFTVIPYHKDSISSVLQPELSRTSIHEKSLADPTEKQSSILQTLNQTDGAGEQNVKDLIVKAFLEHSGGNIFEATEIISTLSSDVKINEAVVVVSREIIDSVPTSDPRWAQHTKSGSQFTSNSVLIKKQLEDKERVFEFFLKFLEDVDVFDKLTIYHEDNADCYTKFKLCEHAEKLNAAKALQTINLNEDRVMQKAIELVVEQRGENCPGNHLTEQDIFFREVSKIQDLFAVLSEYEQQSLDVLKSTTDQIEMISSTNAITIAALKNAWLYRQNKASFYQPVIENQEHVVAFIPWTGTNGINGIRSILRQQIALTGEKALPYTDSASVSATLLQQTVDLADLLLDGYITQLQFIKDSSEAHCQLKSEFEKERMTVIAPLFEQEHYKMAQALAEKYEDFALMIMICDKENDMEKLEKYKTTFAEKGFLDFLFQWYMDRGEWGKLLSQGSSAKLEAFLKYKNQLRWLHHIGIGEYDKASSALRELADDETTCLARKKTMLSIAKLCLIASRRENSDNTALEEIQTQLDIILHQETLPEVVIENSGIDPNNMPPLSVEDLIQLYTGDENPTSNEYDFKRALDLVQFVENTKKEQLWNQTWERAILKDDWTRNITADPLVTISETTFYKCAKLFENEASDVHSVLPQLDVLQSSETLNKHELSSNENFLFLIKAFYESLSAR